MIATPEEITALEKYFDGHTVPRQLTVLNSVTFTDLPKFIKQTIQFIKAPDVSEVVKRPRWEDLLLVKKKLEETRG
jgi:hypothetical protein